jgi:hypothetical protein
MKVGTDHLCQAIWDHVKSDDMELFSKEGVDEDGEPVCFLVAVYGDLAAELKALVDDWAVKRGFVIEDAPSKNTQIPLVLPGAN